MKSKKQNRKKIFEFLTLICMVIGIVLGTGEFVKNDTGSGHVLGVTNNAYIGIIVWIVIGISCIFTMLCFIEIASSNIKNGRGTLACWSNNFISRRVGSLVSIFLIFVFQPIITTFFSLLAVKYIFATISPNINHSKLSIIYIFLGLSFFIFFSLMNSFSRKPGKYFQITGTFLKAIPFIFILIIGFFFPSNPNAFNNPSMQDWNTAKFFMATGPILFSFDGFVFANSLQKEVEHKEVIFSALLTGIIIVVVVYICEAIALFLGTADGSVITMFNNFFSPKYAWIFNWLIIIAIFTSLNGYTMVGPRYLSLDSEDKLIFTFNKKMPLKISGMVAFIIGLFYFFTLGLLGIFLNNGMHNNVYNPIYFIDIFSNITSLFSFTIYIVLMVALIVNRFTKKVEIKTKVKIAPFSAVFSSIILSVCIIYKLYLILAANDLTTYLLIAIVFFVLFLFIINEILLKKNISDSTVDSLVIKKQLLNKKNNTKCKNNKIILDQK